MDYIELSFTVTPKNPGSDILIAHLAELGFDSFTDTETGFSAYIPENLYTEESIQKLNPFQNDEIKLSFQKKIIPSQNWNENWEKSYEPIFISGKCCIRAPFHPVPEKIVYDVVIEPKMSFGTGHHETTSLMIENMLAIELKGKSVLDVGCGTGVLAILASKLGAKKITAIDIDEWAYNNTIENVGTNKTPNIIVFKGEVGLVEEKMDVILANINRNILLADLKKYCKLLTSKGILIMSGFFKSDFDDISDEAKALGLISESSLTRNNWVAAVYSKKN